MFNAEDLKNEIERADKWYEENTPEAPKRYRTTILKVTVTADEVKDPKPGVELYVKGLGTGFIMTAMPQEDGTVLLFVRFNLTSLKKLYNKLTRPS